MPLIAIFASGTGTNAENIIKTFSSQQNFQFIVFCNNPTAEVLQRAEKLGVPSIIFTRRDLYENGTVLQQLLAYKPDLIALAGFLWLIPAEIIQHFPDKIINIHPALLPKFGGKGMYGERVHRAVIEANATVSGITIHYVNENYDEGQIIFQASCPVYSWDTPHTLAERVHKLEYEHYPKIIAQLLKK
ncbi:MAG: phosphoribosylglycinamide formyltransferase [Cytophagales bacterium]|nr:phosphoribosylglycinamide formyltransferase [Bernardetiaceae bacterium]MDW8210884.1 phosphoribosylglycinamide formyltransferase [Cytophagales bacterium]